MTATTEREAMTVPPPTGALRTEWKCLGCGRHLGWFVNGVAFVASSGEYKGTAAGPLTASQRAQHSMPAVLYALDASTGTELWNSGRTITSFARAGLSAGAGQVYVVTYDNTLYAFGIPMEH